jgi:hypothetical protein
MLAGKQVAPAHERPFHARLTRRQLANRMAVRAPPPRDGGIIARAIAARFRHGRMAESLEVSRAFWQAFRQPIGSGSPRL